LRRVFIETSGFSRELARYGGAALLEMIQALILECPDRGDLIVGTAGVRKLRVGDPSRGKGKRGGCRVLYLDLPARGHTYLLSLYDKGSVADITPDEKKVIRHLVNAIKAGERPNHEIED